VASIQSPNIPEEPILFRAGKVNKRQFARDFLEKYSHLSQETIIDYFRALFEGMSKDHAYNLYKNTMEERRQLLAGNISDKRIPKGEEPSTEIIRLQYTNINDSSSPEDQFEQFVEQFKRVYQNPYARQLMKAYMQAVDGAINTPKPAKKAVAR
jgi:hypothetical protein